MASHSLINSKAKVYHEGPKSDPNVQVADLHQPTLTQSYGKFSAKQYSSQTVLPHYDLEPRESPFHSDSFLQIQITRRRCQCHKVLKSLSVAQERDNLAHGK